MKDYILSFLLLPLGPPLPSQCGVGLRVSWAAFLRHDNLDLTPEVLAPLSLPGRFGQQEPLSALVMDGFRGREAYRHKVSQTQRQAKIK